MTSEFLPLYSFILLSTFLTAKCETGGGRKAGWGSTWRKVKGHGVESPLKASPLEMGDIINICPRTRFLCPARPNFKLALCQKHWKFTTKENKTPFVSLFKTKNGLQFVQQRKRGAFFNKTNWFCSLGTKRAFVFLPPRHRGEKIMLLESFTPNLAQIKLHIVA